jgi:hypothetical protein
MGAVYVPPALTQASLRRRPVAERAARAAFLSKQPANSYFPNVVGYKN